jgi:hypothetical protein
MSLTPFPYGISSFGVPIVGSGPFIPPSTGRYFWVNSATGKDNNGRGDAPDFAFSTLAYAITKARAAKGDVIIIAPGHTESVISATALVLNKSGVTIVGLGNGNQRPTFTLSTVVGATITVSGAETTLDNIIFNLTGIDAVTVGFTISAAGVTLKNCRVITNGASVSCTLPFSVGADRFTLQNCQVDGTGADTGTTSIIASSAAIAELRVTGCDIRANCSSALFTSASTNHITNLLIANNFLRQSNGTAKNVFNLTTSSTGLIAYNVCNGTTWATAADVASNSSNVALRWFQNYGFDDGAGAVSGVLVPAVGTLA